MKIMSPAFKLGGAMPDRCARESGDRSPPLTFSNVPTKAKSLILLMDDPDAPSGTFTHWIVFDLHPDVHTLQENTVPSHALCGLNDYGDIGYGGPRPPSGTHRYFFRLHALDRRLNLTVGSTRETVERAMRNHVIAQAEWMGRYSAVPANVT